MLHDIERQDIRTEVHSAAIRARLELDELASRKPRRRCAALGWVAVVLVLAVGIISCPRPSPARVVACGVRAVTTPALFPQWIIDWIWGHDRTIGRRQMIRVPMASAASRPS